jgi:hypothetical protein
MLKKKKNILIKVLILAIKSDQFNKTIDIASILISYINQKYKIICKDIQNKMDQVILI